MHLSQRILAERIYRSVLEDEEQFPREYFSGTSGFQRFCHCFRYLIEHYKVFYTIEEAYRFFTTIEGKNFLALYRLKMCIRDSPYILLIVCPNKVKHHY